MHRLHIRVRPLLVGSLLVAFLASATGVHAAGGRPSPDKARVIAHWTPERRAAAAPRDLVIDEHGHGRLRTAADAALGRQLSATVGAHNAQDGAPRAAAGGDTTPPTVTNLVPAEGAVVGSSHAFAADVTDASGIRSVQVVIRYPDGSTTQRISAARTGGDTWSVTINGFTDGGWSWRVEAKDGAPRGGNVAVTPYRGFVVDTGAGGGGGGGGGSGGTVANAEWHGGAVQTAEGRLFYEMPANTRRKGPWLGYICSGTVVTDSASGRSIVLTAAHCVYDDATKAFARNVLFIPNQAGTTGAATDANCYNDPLGCWVASYGVVDTNYTTRTFPANNAWDYAFYVFADAGAHDGNGASAVLDAAAGALPIDFASPSLGALTHALGYSASDDPKLMYCADALSTQGAENWWLAGCGLGGGSSGGSWILPFDPATGSGPIVSVNSWGYTTTPGMAGPKLAGTSAACVFDAAKAAWPTLSGVDGDDGVRTSCP